jgi:hypothetical protein
MTALLLAAGALLILLILTMILRVASLISMVQGTPRSPETGGNKANAIIWLVFLVVVNFDVGLLRGG